jgi:hypothetical protein
MRLFYKYRHQTGNTRVHKQNHRAQKKVPGQLVLSLLPRSTWLAAVYHLVVSLKHRKCKCLSDNTQDCSSKYRAHQLPFPLLWVHRKCRPSSQMSVQALWLLALLIERIQSLKDSTRSKLVLCSWVCQKEGVVRHSFAYPFLGSSLDRSVFKSS